MSELLYLLSVLLCLTAYAVAGFLLWQGVELAYWIFCKITRREY
jgi:hypothetical protein